MVHMTPGQNPSRGVLWHPSVVGHHPSLPDHAPAQQNPAQRGFFNPEHSMIPTRGGMPFTDQHGRFLASAYWNGVNGQQYVNSPPAPSTAGMIRGFYSPVRIAPAHFLCSVFRDAFDVRNNGFRIWF
jgi:hypothetical protein